MSSLFIGDIQEDTLVFDRIYNQYHQVIYANIFKLIKSEAIAEDILQDVFFSLWENRMKIDIQKSVSGWLFIVSYNKSLSILRKKVKEAVDYVENYDAYDDISEEIFLNEAREFKAGINELFPVPQSQINLSRGMLKQNPGY